MGTTGPGRTLERARRSVALVVAAVLVVAAGCGGSTEESTSATDPASEAAQTSSTPSSAITETSTGETAADSPDNDKADKADKEGEAADGDTADDAATAEDERAENTVADGEVANPDQLRRWLGAEVLVVRRAGAPAVVTSDGGVLELADPFPTVRGRYLFDDGTLIGVTGEAACPGFELLGDFHVIADIEPTPGDRPSIIVEDRRALATDAGSGSAEVPRWRFDCAIGTTTDLEPTTEVTYLGEGIQVTKTLDSGLELVETWGLGDTPLNLATSSGTTLLDVDQLTYSYELSADQTTIYATAYSDTGAASPPAAVLAVEVATGEVRWRRDVGGFVWILGDRVLIEVVEPRPETPGDPGGSEIVLVDPATGADLDRIRFTGRIVGLS